MIVGKADRLSKEWFEKVEEHRYHVEPLIHAVAQFTRYNGKKVLEIGVGAGTDHLQWARAGALCTGVDLTDAAIETTRRRLSLYGFSSELKRIDAEQLPFADDTFDVVYSWGVIHHSEFPEEIIKEINRVLKKNGVFLGMMYGRHSLVVFKLWIKHALLKGKPWRTFADVVWNHMESIGTKAYTVNELKNMFKAFRKSDVQPMITFYDRRRIPNWISQFFPDRLGWFVAIKVVK